MADDQKFKIRISVYKVVYSTASNQDLGTRSYWWKSTISNPTYS